MKRKEVTQVLPQIDYQKREETRLEQALKIRTLAASDASSSFSSVVHESAAAEVAEETAEELIFSQKLFAKVAAFYLEVLFGF